jgi:hypothetical protein
MVNSKSATIRPGKFSERSGEGEPQRLKPASLLTRIGTAEAVPFPNLFYGIPLVRIGSVELVQMVEEVREVIVRQEGESDRFSRTDAADGFQLGGG